ncbi:MAG: ABC transporter permease [Propionibacteriaceae bacterium]
MKVVVFVGRRLIRLVLSLVVVSLLTFGALQLAPGDFASIQSAGGGTVGLAAAETMESSQQLQARYGAEVPVWKQYLIFMGGAVTGDMGPSYKYPQRTIEDIIASAFPISASLAVLATGLAILLSVPLGMVAAVKRKSLWDTAGMFIVTLGHGLPNYLAGLALVLLFSTTLGWLPTYGWQGPVNMVMPVIALAVAPVAVLARYVRSSILETLREEYVTAAMAKGGKKYVILVRHVLRNSLMPLVTVVGPALAALATGTIFVEKLFGIPGLGHYFAEAAVSRDMPLLMGSTLFFAALLMVMNLVVDLTYAALDPRVRADLGLTGTVSKADRARLATQESPAGEPNGPADAMATGGRGVL